MSRNLIYRSTNFHFEIAVAEARGEFYGWVALMRSIYHKLAELFHTEENYFLNEDEEFLLSAAEKYGAKGAKQAQALVDEVSGLFAGGNIADEDLDVMMKALQDAYWIAKEKNKKFTPKKYRKD